VDEVDRPPPGEGDVVEPLRISRRSSQSAGSAEVALTRDDVAQWIADVAKALNGEGTVSLRLADSTVELKVPDSVRFEAEIEVDGDEVELELELKWSTARTAAKGSRPKGAADS
jgi:amphi-Trp domain-containing protein